MSSLPEIRPVPKTLFEDYELLGELAAGGMGVIFIARRVGAAGFERVVIIKRIHRHLLDDPEVGRLLREEARLTASIHHPNVIATVDVVESNGEIALVFEYVESLALSALLRGSKTLPPPIAARIACDTLSGLHAAHCARDLHGNALGIVHRDISPQNVLVGRDGVGRLIDFGIAKATARVAETTSLSVRGKLRYMSPEQLSQRPLDLRSDLFSFGAVLYQLLVGRQLYAANDEAQLALLVLMAEEPEIPPHIPPALGDVLRRALARSPDDRFASAKEFEEALSAATVVASHLDVQKYVDSLFGADFEARSQSISRLLSRQEAPQTADNANRDPRVSRQSISESGAAVGPTSEERTTREPLVRPKTTLALGITAGTLIGAGALALLWGFANRPQPVQPSLASDSTPTPLTTSTPPSAGPKTPPSAENSLPLRASAEPVPTKAHPLQGGGAPRTSAPRIHKNPYQ